MKAVKAEQIADWLQTHLSDQFKRYAIQPANDISFDALGLDSVGQVTLMSDLEEWLELELEPTLIYDYPTITALADKVGELLTEDIAEEAVHG
ncbi:acyl carrier protein [Zooshikella marina]|uniref:Acyl carrier protein n=1 Tax=Zooshikella ganghwensis TaxID=202772 RepID=A0A4P9VS20_9GAMM|nr:phosphopantetheine-binding protein [Zooshikella ganghwensis]MBU2705971.1 acyl carrier protein [Zooshikella ganghwensis]RDH46415.1 acyl carrier protein [Zooshikella ganghwensis]